MSLQAVMKHLDVLANAGLISVEKTGRVKRRHFVPETLVPVSSWVNHYEKFWKGQLSALETYLKDLASQICRISVVELEGGSRRLQDSLPLW